MYVVRLIIVLFLILAMVFAYSPRLREEMSHSWENARPGILQLMDGFYAAIRNFVAGPELHDGIDDHAPGVDFDMIITMERDALF